MVKKGVYILLIGLLVCLLFFLTFVSAIDSNESLDSTAYLKQEWTKILENNEMGRIILGIGEILTSLNPIFKVIIGVEYSFSWYALFAFVIWISFFAFFFNLGRGILEGKIIIILILSFIITSFIGMAGAIRQIDDILASFVSDSFAASLILLLSFVILYLLSRFGFITRKSLMKFRRRFRDEKIERDKKLIESVGEGLREGLFDKKSSMGDDIEIFKKEKGGSWKKKEF